MSEKSRDSKKIAWLTGLEYEKGQINGYGLLAYITLFINVIYLVCFSVFWLWGNVWYTDNVTINFIFEEIFLLFGVLAPFTYFPFIVVSLIFQIIGAVKAKGISGFFLVNLVLSMVTPLVIMDAISVCF